MCRQRAQRGQASQALGRSRGGFSTKIHMKTDKKGHPIGFYLTGGEASDSRNFETLLDIGPDIAPRTVVADKGYDAAANREAARERGVCPVIPYRWQTRPRTEAVLTSPSGPRYPRQAMPRPAHRRSNGSLSEVSACACGIPHRTTPFVASQPRSPAST